MQLREKLQKWSQGGIRGSEKGHTPPLAWVAQAEVQKAGMAGCSKGTTKEPGKTSHLCELPLSSFCHPASTGR